MLILGMMHARGFMKKNTEHKNDCYAHEFKHCGILIKFPWKVKVTYENKV